jgi:hypothetical protein
MNAISHALDWFSKEQIHDAFCGVRGSPVGWVGGLFVCIKYRNSSNSVDFHFEYQELLSVICGVSFRGGSVQLRLEPHMSTYAT